MFRLAATLLGPQLGQQSAQRMNSAIPAPFSGTDSFRFLDNGVIRLGIDVSRGGTLGWLGPSSNTKLSLLNTHDYGRVVQGSFYSGPNPFDPEGKCSEPGGWGRPWPWNPIGAGACWALFFSLFLSFLSSLSSLLFISSSFSLFSFPSSLELVWRRRRVRARGAPFEPHCECR